MISVEGSTIIIATCIPTLQPLLEAIRGRKRRTEYSSSGRNYNSFGSSGQQHTDLELAQKRKIKPRSEVDSIMMTRNDNTESQENIVGSDETSIVTQDHTGRIVKTEEVRITYGGDTQVSKTKDHPSTWRPK